MNCVYNQNKLILSFSVSLCSLILCFFVFSCRSFKHGYTWDKALNSYQLVTGNKDNFGDKRLDYNKGFHRNSQLSEFLGDHTRGLPNFIYEYQSTEKCRGIKLFYVERDSVFVFEEPKKRKFKISNERVP